MSNVTIVLTIDGRATINGMFYTTVPWLSSNFEPCTSFLVGVIGYRRRSHLSLFYRFIIRQDPETFYPFDQEAQKILDTLPARHKTYLKASDAITQAAGRISSGTESGRSALRNGLTYDQLLAG